MAGAAHIELIEDCNAALKELVGDLLGHREVVEGGDRFWRQVVADTLHDTVCQSQILQPECHPEEGISHFQCSIPFLTAT